MLSRPMQQWFASPPRVLAPVHARAAALAPAASSGAGVVACPRRWASVACRLARDSWEVVYGPRLKEGRLVRNDRTTCSGAEWFGC